MPTRYRAEGMPYSYIQRINYKGAGAIAMNLDDWYCGRLVTLFDIVNTVVIFINPGAA